MTDDRSLERAARSWLEIGPTSAPSHAVEAALLRIETTPQERDLRIPRRFTVMPMSARVAAAAIIGVLLVGGAVYLFSPGSRSNVGLPGPTPTTVSSPQPSPSPSPAASASPVAAAAPQRTLGDWQAISDKAIPGLFGANQHIQLSVDWQDGLHTWIQTPDGSQVLMSSSRQASADEIRLVSTAGAEAVGCTDGQVGLYRWSRTADGMFLTLTAIDDACSDRVTAMARTWVHSLSAVTDGGAGVIPIDGAWLKATLPSQRYGLSGDVDYIDLSSIEGPDRHFNAVTAPYGVDGPCAAIRQPLRLLDTTDRFVSYVKTLPGFTVATASATVAGLPAIHVTITPKGSATCQPDGSTVAFHMGPANGVRGEFAPSSGVAHSMWLVIGPKDPYLFVYDGDAVTPADESTMISSIQLLATLPTP